MAILLQISKAHKSYGDQVLLDGAEATLSDNAKVGFIGRNGAGKSTLLRIILGEEELDSGEVIRYPNLRLGYLRQHDPFQPGETSLGYLKRDSGQPDWKCGEIAGQFEIKGAYLDGPVAKLSGGWQTRLKIAALLLHEPNLLLLDEPTNFLDLRTQILLEHFLQGYRGACLVVSHDRAFLSATCNHTLDLSHGKLISFPGKVDAHLVFQKEKREQDIRTNASVLAKMRHLEEFIAKNKARAATATLARSKSKQLERMELTALPTTLPTVTMRAPQIQARKGPALRCKNLAIGYPEREIASDVNLEIDHGTRAAIVGDNGQGKTTFLRTVVNSLTPLSGEVRWGHGCQIGVYAQHVYTSLPENQTVIDFLHSKAARGKKDQEILDIAGAFLFRGPHTLKPISVLSGGERARLCLAALLLSNHNILILDEPGNHLDVDTVDALGDALLAYEGTVIFTSHDRHFAHKIATCIIEVRDGRVTTHGGNYDSYVYKVNKEVEAGERERANDRVKLPPEIEKAQKPAGLARVDMEPQKEIKLVEKTIASLDGQRKALQNRQLNTNSSKEFDTLQGEIEAVAVQLSEAEDRWSELFAIVEGFA